MKKLFTLLAIFLLFGSMTANASYYIVGTFAENGWDADNATLMVNNEITYTLSPGDNEFKVLTTLGSWNNQLNYNNIDWSRTTATCEEEAEQHNVMVVLSQTSDVHIFIVNGMICVTATPVSNPAANSIITYTATNQINIRGSFGANIVNHTFSYGVGTIIFDSDVTSIGFEAFYGCSGLTSITIPNSVTSIGSYAFQGCSSLTSITIPNSVTSIGDRAFYSCSGLTSITIPNSVTSIGRSAFSDCSGLTSITISNSVTSIGDDAFYSCSGLTSVTIPNSVTSIGVQAFRDCSGLTSITIPNSVTSIGNHAFWGCSGLTSITIPNSVTSIGNYAFGGCSGLTSVTIGNSVTSIGERPFHCCSSLTSIVVESGNTTFDSRNNCNAIIETTWNTLIVGCQNTVIPNSVTRIGSEAFYGCSGLTSITIPNSVTSIDRYAFRGCSGLTSITIPNSVENIGDYAFSDCTKLRYITCYAPEPPVIREYTFSNYNINLNVPCDYLDEYKFHAVWGSFRYIECIDAEESTVTTTTVTPSTTEATFAWPTSTTANTYTLTITKDGVVFCTLTFNANGQLLNIAFAPGRDGATHAPEAELTATGYQFTVTGLESGSTYAYTLDAKDAGNNVVANYSGTFTTTGGEMGVEHVDGVNKYVNTPTKVVRDGQVLIQRGDRLYDLRGQEVK